MLIDPATLADDLDRLEDIEKVSLRLVVQAILDFRTTANEIFTMESDRVADIAEDITREALDSLGVSKINQRLFGKIDHKRARYLFLPDFAVKQALFVDSKAEKLDGQGTATLQTSQLSMGIHFVSNNQNVDAQGSLPNIINGETHTFLTTTIFVKYNYAVMEGNDRLSSFTVAALPNGMLQERYNPTNADTIFRAGRHSPQRGGAFRVRLSYRALKAKARWRVQHIPLAPEPFDWDEEELQWEE